MPPDNERGRPAKAAPTVSTAVSTDTSVAPATPGGQDAAQSACGGLVPNVEHFQRRVIADALTDAMAVVWHRRAAVFEAARPRPGDFNGRATPMEMVEQDSRCAVIAKACRHRATLGLGSDDLAALDDVLSEVA